MSGFSVSPEEWKDTGLDIITALTAVGQAIKITKDLREIDRGLDTATYKAKMAELYENLSDVKMALTDARETIHDREKEIKNLKGKIEEITSGDVCPLCMSGRMKIIHVKPHGHFAFAGVQERTHKCQNPNCNHSETRVFDPSKNKVCKK